MAERWVNVIDAARAARYHDRDGLSWREVGIVLAEEEGRDVAYQPESVKAAVVREKIERIKA